MKCSICKQEGHNKRSCKGISSHATPQLETESNIIIDSTADNVILDVIDSNKDISTINDVRLSKEGAHIYVTGNSYPLKDVMKDHGAKWNPDKKKWYFIDKNPDLNHLLKDTIENYICCPFAFNIDKEAQSSDCKIKCKKYKDIQDDKERKTRHNEYVMRRKEALDQQIKEDVGKYIVVYYCRDCGETDEYGKRFDTLDEAEANFNINKEFLNRRAYTPFASKGTLWGINIVHNNKIINGRGYNNIGKEFNTYYRKW